ncbi:MAG: hypothetical protein ACI39C_07520 [Dietzia sp.]
MTEPHRAGGGAMVWGVDAFERATILAALGEYAAAHPELVAQVDQAEAAVLAEWKSPPEPV